MVEDPTLNILIFFIQQFFVNNLIGQGICHGDRDKIRA
jgi:hypothetical protein